ncbi:hypothetical protein [Anabaena sp. YBS01]|uniref:hypothetical protein n=1 Tax=Anabaena sp. YBS01 TaxID=2490939 RepID=UPI001293080E|nr:hypothetical protein [Anabaena sp. YBS01]
MMLGVGYRGLGTGDWGLGTGDWGLGMEFIPCFLDNIFKVRTPSERRFVAPLSQALIQYI